MPISFSVQTLVAAFTLSLFLGVLNFWFWRVQREDRTPLWMAAWLSASALFTLCRLLQYETLSEPLFLLLPRILLSVAYPLAWLAYELGNSFIDYHPPRWERILIILLVAIPVMFLWTGGLILTDQIVIRTVAFGGQFTGVQTGSLYMPFSILILILGAIPVVRLTRASNSHKRENRLMAAGISFLIIFSLSDFITTAFGLVWIRFTDFSYLPVAIFFSYIQVQRLGRLYGDMNLMVQERTAELSQANTTLSSSEERYRKLIDTALDVIFTISLNGTFTSLNPSFETITGWSRSEWLGRAFDDLIAEEDRTQAHEYFDRVLHAETLRAIRLRVQKRDGGMLVVELNISPQIRNGQTVGLLGIARDITEEQHAEDALRESEEKYRATIESANDGITIIQKGIVRYVNLRLAKMRDEKVEEIIGQRFDIFVHPRERHKIIEHYQRQRTGGDEPTMYETVLLRKDNSRVFAELTIGSINYQGAPAEIVIVRDITERKQAEESRQQTMIRLQREVSVVASIAASTHLAEGAVYELAVDLTEAASGALGIERVNVWLFEGDETRLVNIDSYLASTGEHASGAVLLESEFQNEFAALKSAKYVDAHDPLTDPRTTGYVEGYLKPNRITSMLDGVIRFAGRNLGLLCFEHVDKPHYWENDEITFVCQLADQLALAISNRERKQAEEEIHRKIDEMATLYETTHDLVVERDLSTLLHTIVERAAGLLETSGGGMYLCEPEESQVRCVVSYNTPQDYTGTVLKYGEGAAGLVASTGKSLVIDDYRNWKGRAAIYDQDQPFISLMSAPLYWQNQLIGILHVTETNKARAFTQEEMRILTLFADQAAIAIENARLLSETHQRAEEFSALFEIMQDLASQRDLSDLLRTIVEHATTLLNTPTCAIFLYNATHNNLEIAVTKGLQLPVGTYLEFGEGMAGRVAQTRQPLIVEDYSTWEHRSSKYEEIPMSASVTVPMSYGSKLIGVLDVSELQPNTRKFTEADVNLLTLFANQASIAIENSRLFETEQHRRKEADAIAEIGHDISSTLQLDVALERIATHAKDLLNAETSAVYLFEPTRSILRAIVAIGPDAEEIKGDPLKIGEGILGNIALQKSGEIVNDTVGDSRAITVKGTEINPLEHLIGVPVLLEDQLTSLIAVWRTGEKLEFKSMELDLLSRLAGQVAVAINNARLFEAEQMRRQEADTLREAAHRITSTLNQEQAIQLILEQLARVVLFESASIQLIRDDYLEIVGGQGWPNPSVVLGLTFPITGDTPNSIVVRECRSVILGNAPEVYSTFTNPPHTHIHSWLGVPLVVRDRVIGMFAVDHSLPDFFTDADVQMVNAFAGQAAIAIENARLFEETEKRLREAEALSQVGIVLSQTLELESLLENILATVITAIPAAERGSTLLADDERILHIRAVCGYTDPRVLGFSLSSNTGYATLCFREQRALIIPDVHANETIRFNGDIPEMLTGGSAMAVPMIVKDQVIGVIALDTPTRKNAFNEDDLYLLKTIGASTALVVENARLFESTRQRLSEIEAVYTVSMALRVAQTLDEALPIILNKLMSLLNAGGASLEMMDLVSEEIVTELALGVWAPVTGLRTPKNVGVSWQVITTGEPYVTTDVIADGNSVRPDLFGGLHAVACAPVIAQHQPIGTMWIGRQTPFLEEEVSLLAAIGEMVGNAIQRMRLHEQTELLLNDLRISNLELSKAYDTTLEGWAKALELRDKETEGHSRRVESLTIQLASRMGISESDLLNVRRGILLHDIGKMGVPDHLLRKTGPLSDDEWVEMRKHPEYAYDMLYPITYLRPALDIPYCHHENWDGSGYPRGLAGENIPLAARIFAVVDVWDALSHDRPYRKAWSREKILSYIKKQSGIKFDPKVVDEFLKVVF